MSTPDYRLCSYCGQPMLPKGEVKKPNEYDHAQGCPLAGLPHIGRLPEYACSHWTGYGIESELAQSYLHALSALKTVIASASPNEREHPAMFKAWKQASAVLEKAGQQ